MDQPLTPARMEERRALMIQVLEDMKNGFTYLKPFKAAPRERQRHGGQPGNQSARKPAEAKIATKTERLNRIMARLEGATTKEEFERLRDRYYTEKSALKRFCEANGLEMPEIPLAPISLFPGAKPRIKLRRQAS